MTKSKYILISYNNKGIIPIPELENILNEKGKVYKIPFENGAYNKYLGIAEKKRQRKKKSLKNFMVGRVQLIIYLITLQKLGKSCITLKSIFSSIDFRIVLVLLLSFKFLI